MSVQRLDQEQRNAEIAQVLTTTQMMVATMEHVSALSGPIQGEALKAALAYNLRLTEMLQRLVPDERQSRL
jgi:hypothetical protein